VTYCYLFEANFIQRFLFNSGKLKDVIAASERLDKLIDNHEYSVLSMVLQKAQLNSDLMNPDIPDKHAGDEVLIRFLRCKGGAFYAYCSDKAPLLRLRSIWTLTLGQLFPSLSWADALVEGATLKEAMNNGHQQMGADRNSPSIQFPIGSSISQRSQRTGQVAVPLKSAAKKSSHEVEPQDNTFLDLETEHHRQAYTHYNLKTQAALQERYTPNHLHGELFYPVDLEKDFAFSAEGLNAENKEATKDIALIHIDGNGLGILLRALQEHLTADIDYSDERYRKGFRLFSDSLAKATQEAAKQSTEWLYQDNHYQQNSKTYIPMRPLILGGDDVTLLCRADLALEYSERFCRAFKLESEKALKPLFKDYLSGSDLKHYLTASGGILYHKASHPFTHSHHLVEDLCAEAKKLTKTVCKTDQEVGPAALALYRLSNASAENFATLKQQSRVFTVNKGESQTHLELGQYAYFVAEEIEAQSMSPNFTQLKALAQECRNDSAAVSMTKWRQIVSKLALGDKAEADRMYRRALSNCTSTEALLSLKTKFQALMPPTANQYEWYWQQDDTDMLSTLLSDLLIVDHFRPVSKPKTTQEEKA
jgi:hypothetical protein